ncbi:MAG: hypothetical protein KA795_06945 [Burkholderiaceae bacterium]|nr:hypothetical protein [Burkholderiaceae bacterium]
MPDTPWVQAVLGMQQAGGQGGAMSREPCVEQINWIAACAHRLHRQWRSMQIEDVE